MASVTVDVSGVARKLAQIEGDTAFGTFLATEARDGMERYVPYDTGRLRTSAVAEPFAVTYDTPYARRVHEGRGMTFRTPGTTAHWERAYAAAHGQELGDAGTRYLKRKG